MDHIHTRIDRPLELRKNILESAIDASDMLKNFDQLKQIVEDKDLFIGQIKQNLNDFTNEVSKLKDILPPIPEEFNEKAKKAAPKKNGKYVAYMSEREKLENDLNDIRKRMAKVTVH